MSAAPFPGRPELFDATPEAIAALREIDPAWPHVMARSILAMEMRATAAAILKDDVTRGEEPWSTLSAELLFAMARERSEWILLEETALLARTLVGMEETAGRARAEALYRQERYDEVLDAAIITDDETALWRAVAERELGRETWRRAFLDIFLAHPASDVHRRLYLYLFYRGDLAAFPGAEQQILAVSYRVAIGERGEARRLLRTLSRPTVENVGGGDASGFLETVGRAFAAGSAADATAGIEWYGDRGDAPPEILERAGRYDEARRAYAARGDAAGAVRTALSAGVSLSEAIESAGGTVAAQADRRGIERILSSEFARLVRERNVAELTAIRNSLPREFSRLHARIELILHHFGEEVSFDSAHSLAAGTYERFWAEYIEERPISLVEGGDVEGTGDSAGAAGGDEGAHRFSDTPTRLAEHLLGASLHDDAYRELRRAIGADEIDPADVARFAGRFAEAGRHFESITLLRIALAESDRGPRAAERDLLYPRLYPGEFVAASEEGGFPASLLHGLVREESHYRVAAQSPADAQGLAQVLPGTAADMARRIGMDTYDIHGVSDNLRLGSAYLTFLFERLETPVEVLAGYNAGYRRAVDWTAEFGDLHPVLFVEAIPFAETRAYVRNVVRSALYYEDTLEPADYLELLFGLGGAQ